jgi:excisionase family DNA binding protein
MDDIMSRSRPPRPPYRLTEAAKQLGISDQLTLKLIKRGELDAFRLGRLWMVRPESVERLLASGTAA